MRRIPLFPALALAAGVALVNVGQQIYHGVMDLKILAFADDEILTGSTDKKPAQQEPFVSSNSEQEVLNRLQQRREQLEQREKQLDLRESLLKAADQKVESRIEELKAIEARVKQSEAQGGEAQSVKQLALMYETMKPKDAARVFERLDMQVLLPIAQAIAPRKLAEILAAMSAQAAERLTLDLARGQRGPSPAPTPINAPLPPGELPSIAPVKSP